MLDILSTKQGNSIMRKTARSIELAARYFWADYYFPIIFVAFQVAAVSFIAITR
jgi:hypothetical protein